MEDVDVVLTGKLLAGTDFDAAVGQFAALTKLDHAKVARLLQSNTPTVVKRNVSPEVGERYRTGFTAIGVEVELRPAESIAGEDAVSPQPTTTAQASPTPPPPASSATEACHDEQSSTPPVTAPGNGEQTENGPSPVARGAARGQSSPPPRNEGLQTLRVPAAHGWRWVKEATDLYMDEQVLWASMCLFPAILMLLMALIPYVGNLGVVLLGPVFAGGLMLAAHGQKQGETLCFSALFQGFRHNRNQLLWLGVLQMLIPVCIGVVSGIGAFMMARLSGQVQAASLVIEHPFLSLFLGLVALTVFTAMGMAFLFGPCLVAISGTTAWKSIGISFRATLHNWSAFLVFSLVASVAMLVVMVVLVLAGMLLQLASVLNLPNILLQIAILVLLCPIIALFTLTTYTAFRDIFLTGN